MILFSAHAAAQAALREVFAAGNAFTASFERVVAAQDDDDAFQAAHTYLSATLAA